MSFNYFKKPSDIFIIAYFLEYIFVQLYGPGHTWIHFMCWSLREVLI